MLCTLPHCSTKAAMESITIDARSRDSLPGTISEPATTADTREVVSRGGTRRIVPANKYEVSSLLHEADMLHDADMTQLTKANPDNTPDDTASAPSTSHPANEAAWNVFQQLDRDGSGMLDVTEFGKLAELLGLKMSRRELHRTFRKLDGDAAQGEVPDGEIGFEAFCYWFNPKKEAQRRENRVRVLELFQEVDMDDSGALDKEEIGLLMRKAQGKLKLIAPAFDLDTDWEKMGKTTADCVTFHHFELWWKERTGVVEVDIPVLPESMVAKISEVGERVERRNRKLKGDNTKQAVGQCRRPDKRLGADLWDFLRPRLKLIVQMQTQWGGIHQLYPSNAESLYNESPLPKNIRHPNSAFSCYWDLTQIVMLSFVGVTVPMRSCFFIEVDNFSAGFFIDLIVDVYFICDLFLSFRTAYWDANGLLEANLKRIAVTYMKGWFIIDLTSSLPLQYVMLIANAGKEKSSNPGETDSSAAVRTLKAFRLLRMMKLLRLRKMLSIFKKYQDFMSTYMRLVALLLGIMFMMHLLSCFFYLGGSYDQKIEHTGHVVKGWVARQEGWGETRNETRLVDLNTRWITSLVHSLAPIDFAETATEQYVSVLCTLSIGVIFGTIASVMTQIGSMVQSNQSEMTSKLQSLKEWMTERDIPKPNQTKVISYFHELWMMTGVMNEEDILSKLPPAMEGEISRTLYADVISSVPIFKNLSDEIITAICRVVVPCIATKEQRIFTEGEPGEEMYFLIKGEIEVSVKQGSHLGDGHRRLGFLGAGAFFGELPVLSDGRSGTMFRTRSARAMTACRLCFITRKLLRPLCRQYTELHVRLLRFRRMGSGMKKTQIDSMMGKMDSGTVSKMKEVKKAPERVLRKTSLLRHGTDALGSAIIKPTTLEPSESLVEPAGEHLAASSEHKEHHAEAAGSRGDDGASGADDPGSIEEQLPAPSAAVAKLLRECNSLSQDDRDSLMEHIGVHRHAPPLSGNMDNYATKDDMVTMHAMLKKMKTQLTILLED